MPRNKLLHCFPHWHRFVFPQTMYKCFLFSTSRLAFVVLCLLGNSHCDSGGVMPHSDFGLHFLMIRTIKKKKYWIFFMYILGICTYPLNYSGSIPISLFFSFNIYFLLWKKKNSNKVKFDVNHGICSIGRIYQHKSSYVKCGP